MTPLVSIITPAFNAAKFVGCAIESAQLQTFGSWEMIIVDDCSTDDTIDVVNQYAAADSRIYLIRQPENGGPARARNAALKAAKGRYIAFLDSDDLWLPAKLELQLAFMTERGAAFSFTSYRRFSSNSDRPEALISLNQTFDYRSLLKNTGIGCLTVVLDRELIGPIEMPLVRAEDYALWLNILKRGFKAEELRLDLARYRVVNGSVSGNKLKSASWVWHIYRNVEKLCIPYAAWCFANYGWQVIKRRLT